MIISRTPFRVSFVGGGTDLDVFCRHEDGQVLSTSIDKYIYVAVKRQLDIVEYRYRVNWSQVEFKDSIDDIEHPIVREALRLMEIDFPVEVTTFADVPANTGLGSSSAFAVGLLHALFALKGRMVTKYELARLAAEIEIEILGRNIGAQDHFASAYGSLNMFTFKPDRQVVVEPVFYDPEVKLRIESNLMLFYTGLQRDASEVLEEQCAKTPDRMDVLRAMKALVAPLAEVISSGSDIDEFGRILHEGWLLKRSVADSVSSAVIDTYYERARAAGAIGGKLLGAGGGGFLLFYVHPEDQPRVCESLSDLYHLRFAFDDAGTRITYYDQRMV